MNLAYHRLFRQLPNYRWWRPLVALVAAFVLYYAFTIVYQEVLLLVVRAFGGASASSALLKAVQQNQQDASKPLVMAFTLGSLATMLPGVLLGVRLAGLGRVGQLTSVVGRFRWRWMARCIVPAAVFIALTIGLGAVLPASWQGPAISGSATPVAPLVISSLLIVLLVPLQASAEEFAFRGLGMQAVGAWLRPPVFAIVIPTVGFALAHSYNVWGKLDVAALGVSFAYLTWRTGGLEAGIVGHVVNNVVVFLISAPTVSAQQNDGSPAAAAITVVASVVFVALVEWQLHRHPPEGVLHRRRVAVSGVGSGS